MRDLKYGDKVIYTGSRSIWNFEKHYIRSQKGMIYQLFKTPGNINYMVEFENGLLLYIDHKDLRLIG
jgi:hypothetical protein